MQAPSHEALPRTHIWGYSVNSFEKTCVDTHWHFHQEYELTFIEKGEGIRHIGRSILPFERGDLCLIGSNLSHAYLSHKEQRRGAIWSVLHFTPELWGKEFWALPQNKPILTLFNNATQGIVFKRSEARVCANLLLQLEERGPNNYAMPLLLELFERLAKSKRQQYLNPREISASSGVLDPRVKNIMDWVSHNYRRPDLSQLEAANYLGMTAPGFSHFFKSKTGRSFRRYVNEMRIADVCSKLGSPEERICDAAYSAGFNNIANFNRRFKEILGKAPSTFQSVE